MRKTAAALALFAVAALSGCTDIPLGGEPVVVASTGPSLGRLSIAPIATFTLAESERSKNWKPEEVFVRDDDPSKVRLGLEHALEKTGSFSSIREAKTGDPVEAWENHDDLLLSVSVENIRIGFERNGWYYWNIANFIFNVWPAWMVAKEDYTLAFDANVTVQSGDSGNALLENDTIPVSVKGSFDEFDRGFQFFGCLSVSLEPENWRLVASKLLPAARQQLAEKLAKELDAPLRRVLAEKPERFRKELLVAVGITRYADTTRYPQLAYAAKDAAAVASAFRDDELLLPHQETVLNDERATRSGVDAAIDALVGRANEGDTSIFYFAGYGTRNPNGEPALALYDSGTEAELVPLRTLVDHLAKQKGQKLIILDCSFDHGRAVRGGPAPRDDSELAKLGRPDLRILTACGPGETAVAPDHVAAGLLTHELLQGLSGKADDNKDGRITLDELFVYARERVIAEASYRGEAETPRLAGGGEIAFEPKRGAAQ